MAYVIVPVMKWTDIEEMGDVHLFVRTTGECSQDLTLAGHPVVAKSWNNTSL